MSINSRSKGNRNERVAAALLSVWTKRDFARTPSSGGLSWKSSNSKGDIVCTTEGHFFPFCAEIKAHKEIDFAHLLVQFRKTKKKSGLPKILEFWSQCERDAIKAKKVPMLMMRYDRLPADFFFMAFPQSFFATIIGLDRLLIEKSLKYHNAELKMALFILPSTEFFRLPYKSIKKLAKEYIKTHYEK